MVEPLEQRQLLAQTVSIDLNTPLQTIRAIGANTAKNARNPWPNDPVRDATTNYHLNNFDVGMLRVAINIKTWEPTNDNADPNVVRAAGFPDLGGIRQNFELMREYTQKGVPVIASVFDLPDWMVSNPEAHSKRELKPGFEAELAESISHWLNHAREQYGVKVDFISINEGNGGYNARFNQLIFTNFLRTAGPYMAGKGLGYVKWFFGDDGVHTLNSHTKPLLENPDIRQYLGPVAYHSWSFYSINDSALSQWAVEAGRYGKEVWVTEFGTDAYVPNLGTMNAYARAHDTALAYWRALSVTKANVILWWQFANDFTLVDAQTFAPKPPYYAVKPFHDHVKPGAQMVKVSPNNTGAIKTLATRDAANNKFFAQVFNGGSVGTSGESVTLTGLPNTPLTFVRNTENDLGRQIGTFTPVNGRLTFQSPAYSWITISGKLNNTAAGAAPVATISAPTGSTRYGAGQTISFSGIATDAEDGALPANRFNWIITPIRNGLVAAPLTFNGIRSGSFTIPAAFQRAIDQKYVIELKVTDSSGQTSVKSTEIRPQSVKIAVKSNVPGLAVGLNSLWESTSAPQSMVAGTQNLFAPSPQWVDGKVYKFSIWSMGGAATRSIAATADATYTANYTQVTDGSAGRFVGATADAFVRDGDGATSNFGSSAILENKQSLDLGRTRLSYLKFDVSSFSAVGTAKLRLFGNLSGNGEIVETRAYSVSNNWSENTITFNNRPTLGATAIAATTVADLVGRWYEFDVTAAVKTARAAGAGAVSFALAQSSTSSPFAGFNAREATANQPQLLVVGGSTVSPPVSGEINTVADAYVRDAKGNTNYGTGDELAVQSGVSGLNRRAYLKFDLSSIGSFSSVMLKLSARLSESVTDGLSVGVFDADDNWTETGLTWNNRPRERATPLGSVKVRDTTRRTYELDLTAYIQAQKAAGRQTVTLVLKNMSNTASAQAVFAARESNTGGARLATA